METERCYYLFDYEKGCLPEMDVKKPKLFYIHFLKIKKVICYFPYYFSDSGCYPSGCSSGYCPFDCSSGSDCSG